MPYDEGLAQRVREQLDDLAPFDEKKMFGGLCFLVRGNMACGILGYELIVRVGPAGYEKALARPGVREFDFTGRPMKGWVVVSADSHEDDEEFAEWLEQGVAFARSLPSK